MSDIKCEQVPPKSSLCSSQAELRQAEQELAQRKEKELALARQMADQEEMNLELEEKFGSLQDEVDAKTKKLKKLWSKVSSSVEPRNQ